MLQYQLGMPPNNHKKSFNPFAECREARLTIWQCPPFLFLVLGVVTIISMIATYLLSSSYVEEPQVAALIVTGVAVLFIIVGNLVISGFHRVAEANHMKEEFISLVSHQLRSPLSIFKWTLEALRTDIQKETNLLSSGAENYFHTLRDTNENMIKMVNTLLEVNRIDAQSLLLKKEKFSLAEISEKTVETFRRYADSSNIKFISDIPPSLPYVLGDRDRLSVVIENLIDNAVRYTKTSGNIIIKISLENNWLKWSIEDRGVGIPSGQQKYIFNKFFRAGNSWSWQAKGSGLGLYLARAVIEASGGKIGFQSEENKGSVFWFTLPASG